MYLIGLTGAAGCGKDTLADELKKTGWKRFAFADALKGMCMQYLGLTYEDAYTQEGKMKYNDFWGMTNREILQKVGTDAFREGFHKETWTKIGELRISDLLNAWNSVVVTDVRFDNEAELIEKLGGIVVKINRNAGSNLTESEKKHLSEQGVKADLIAFEVENNATPKDMYDTLVLNISYYEKRNSIIRSLVNPFLNYADGWDGGVAKAFDADSVEKLVRGYSKYGLFDLSKYNVYPSIENKFRFENPVSKKAFEYYLESNEIKFDKTDYNVLYKANWTRFNDLL